MSDNEINIVIAEEMGFRAEKWESGGWMLYRENRRLHHPLDGTCSLESCFYQHAPDYCNDLNAIQDAVMTLPENKQVLYGARLAWVCGHTDKGSVGLWKISTATARQRAEAFLKTIGKWEDGAK